jgi:hypothetical protein
MRRPTGTGVPGGARSSFKRRLGEYLASERPDAITETVWRQLLERLAPVSEGYLRQLLWATGLPFSQPHAGIRQHTFEELEQSLAEMGRIYGEAADAGDRKRARYCRRLVIGAKDRAKFAAVSSRTTPGRQAQKREMAQWMLVWLDDPAMFPAWVESRKHAMGQAGTD